MAPTKIITIIGFGEVGSTVITCLNSSFSGVLFHIVDPHQSISGRMMDAAHACASRKNDITFNDYEMTNQSDVIVYAAGFSNQQGVSRMSVAAANKELVFTVFEHLSLKPDCLVLAITNPVDLVSSWIYEALRHANLVVGTGTSLDTFRMNYMLAEKEQVSIHEVNTMILGEHGQHMTLIPSQCKLLSKGISHYYNEEQLTDLMVELRGAASKIRETEKATKYGVASAAQVIIQSYFSAAQTIIPCTVKLGKWGSSLFDCSENVFMSLPCFISNQEISVQEIEFQETELNDLKLAAKFLQNHLLSV
jgi:L-lactate dehydrogenase